MWLQMPGRDWGQVCLQIHPQEAQEEEGSQEGNQKLPVNGQHGRSHQRQPQEIRDHGFDGRFRCLPEQVRSFCSSHDKSTPKLIESGDASVSE